ncbi:DUF3105 domain-containing protein [Actinomadura barringtoniae]|uniref:DUF3105 domain-containing protein n=1 Tax=Actinomadura barringtoniae TaxID=1427535 RepID=A0A939PIA0_9ACTN|nr:DUF3105 domain-containing protein [Actinomadura barringtoniae]MBO2452777.1 DUF3105 domain-containing protein [Actinomadura barringtoniae]
MSKNARNRVQAQSARERLQQQNALTERTIPWGGIAFFGVIGVIVIVAIGYAVLQTRPDKKSSASADSANTALTGVVSKNEPNRNHVSGSVKYDSTPPMGGDHDPMWQNCDGRVYDSPLRNENAVHSLEHGAVWITYKPGLAAAQVDKLKSKVNRTDYTLMSPYPGLDASIVLSAWGKQLKLQDASDGRVDAFLKEFVKGQQTPEPGAACTGAKDTP